MRILKSFDTKTDTEELESAISKYWLWNAILVKRHRILLIPPMIGIFVANCVFWLLLYLIHTQYYKENSFLYWLIIVIYVYTTFSRCIHSISWILSNIIWQTTAKKQYVDDLKNAQKKQKGFERFLKHSFLTFVIHFCLMILNATIPFILIKSTGVWSILMAISIFVVDFIFLLLLNRIMYRIIEYEMNFDIFTTNSFSSYTQKWFFKTQEMDIATSAIKIIQSSKEWLAWALLQYWNLYIHTDWDLNIWWGKTLELSYIPNPKKLAKKLNAIIEKSE